jgi:hypothetical protein
MNFVPSSDQVTALLRTYLPAVATVLTAYGLTRETGWVTTAILVAGPLGVVICGIWSLIANTRAAIMRKASKPLNADTPAPQIVLPAQEKALADALPSNVTSQPMNVTSIAGKSAAVLAILFLAAMMFPGNAMAQTKLKLPIDPLGLNGTPVTGNASKDMQVLWQKIVASSIADLNYAAAMAASANTTTSGVRLQCLKAIIVLNEQASGANLKNPDGSLMAKPDPHLFTDVESLAEIVDNLSPQGPLFVNCAGAAQLAKTNVLTFVNAVVTGAAGFAAMPIIPGL